MLLLENLGVVGLTLNLLGALLVIDRLVTFKSIVKKFEALIGHYSMKYLKRFAYNMLDIYIKTFPDAQDREMTIELKERIRIGDYPDIEEMKKIAKERRSILGKISSSKNKRKKRKRRKSLIYEIKNSFMLRIMFFNNPYITPMIFLWLAKYFVTKLVKYQLHLGASLFLIGHIFQIVEKLF